MTNDILYMLGVVAVGFALNFGLRAVPFVIFGTRKGELPAWVAKFGDFISPVIIAALIVYSYSGMQWKTAWPYLAGAVTVGLQVWRRNPLTSIVVGTVVYMCLLNCGCSTQRAVSLDVRNPSVRVSVDAVWIDRDRVPPQAVPRILDDSDIPKTRPVHILLDDDVKDLTRARFLMACLAKGGYTRPVLVTKRHGESFSTGRKPAYRSVGVTLPMSKKIRYKKAGE